MLSRHFLLNLAVNNDIFPKRAKKSSLAHTQCISSSNNNFCTHKPASKRGKFVARVCEGEEGQEAEGEKKEIGKQRKGRTATAACRGRRGAKEEEAEQEETDTLLPVQRARGLDQTSRKMARSSDKNSVKIEKDQPAMLGKVEVQMEKFLPKISVLPADNALRKEEEEEEEEQLEMQSSSPDETALCCFAQLMGYELVSRQANCVSVRVRDPRNPSVARVDKYREVASLQFNSKRKRMTVILQRLPSSASSSSASSSAASASLQEPLLVYTKGADSVVEELIVAGYNSSKERGEDILKGKYGGGGPYFYNRFWGSTQQKLQEYSRESLRCLVLAYCERPADWWFGNHSSSTTSSSSSGSSSLEQEYALVCKQNGPEEAGHKVGACNDKCRICEVERKIEVGAGLDLLGVTAIEDQLQQGVPSTLQQLLSAGIKVWVLTGDNLETAVNICISCRLLDYEMRAEGRLLLLHANTPPDTLERVLQQHIACVTQAEPGTRFGLAVDGSVWKRVLEQHLQHSFLALASKCDSVVACRLEPKEKAAVLNLVKSTQKVSVMAIGDGNNDTPMIQAADVGVGIRGVEGTSAVAAADFAISQFRFLSRLLLAYGHLNSRRAAILINYIFYKGTQVVTALFCFGFFTSFSGLFPFLDWSYQLHNLLFTSLPVIFLALFDTDMKRAELEAHPVVYNLKRGYVDFNSRVFFTWQLVGALQAVVSFFVVWRCFDGTSVEQGGHSFGIWSLGGTLHSVLVLTANVTLWLEFSSWNWLFLLVVAFSVSSFIIPMQIFSSTLVFDIGGQSYYGVWPKLWAAPAYWLILLVATGASWAIYFLLFPAVRVFWPSTSDVYIEAVRKGKNLVKVDKAVAHRYHIAAEPQNEAEALEWSNSYVSFSRADAT